MFEIAIIGAGSAGTSAAIFTAKAGKKTLVIENEKSITKRAYVKNHYGVTKITGPELLEAGIQQAKGFGAEYVSDTVLGIKRTENGFLIEAENNSFEAGQVILATGLLTDLAIKAGLQTKDGTEPRVKTNIAVDQTGKTSVEGIWAAGAVAGASLHTIITAGDGAKVAINIISQLNGERYVDHDVLKV